MPNEAQVSEESAMKTHTRIYLSTLLYTTSAVITFGTLAVWLGGEAEKVKVKVVKVTVHAPSPTPTAFDTKKYYQQLADSAASLCGADKEIFRELINTESRWRHFASRGILLESSAGAIGLAQVKPSSAREVSAGLNVYDPWGNLVAGACLLTKYKAMLGKGGTWRQALYSYHAGPWRKGTSEQSVKYADTILGYGEDE